MRNDKRPPINLTPNKRTSSLYTGSIIVRLAAHVSPGELDWRKPDKKELPGLTGFLNRYPEIIARRLIRSVSPARLLEMERKASASEFPPLRSLTTYWRLDYRAQNAPAQELLRNLRRHSEVDFAYLERSASDPAVNDSDDGYAVEQDYLDPAPVGINARWAWTQANGEGADVGFIDLERAWNLNHEDLVAKEPTLIFNDNRYGVNGFRDDHGTSVLGIVAGVDNNVGIVGVAPGVSSIRLVSRYEAATTTTPPTESNVADAIVAAVNVMAPGDVLLLEVDRNYLPTEIEIDNFDAIRLAAASGIIVVEAAGNGNANLDELPDGEGLHGDSGAIIVGSCESALPHNRYVGMGAGQGSNYGSRINCFAWGERITTSGYGDVDPHAEENAKYTYWFGGTSGAAAIIAGTALIIQGMYQATPPAGGRLSPSQMRTILSDSVTGTPQGPDTNGNIGVMPNLRLILETTLGLTPDVYLRDSVSDTGVVPSSGSISASPDIIVRPVREADPTASFGEGSGNENSNTLSFSVESGHDNYIYVRMRNRSNTANATNTTATVYWSEVSTLVTPDRWNLIGTSTGVTVPAGDTLVVTDPIVWRAADIPETGNYSFVGILNQDSDLAPLIPLPTDWDGFRAFIRNHNNVTRRNFHVINDVTDPLILPFLIAGAPDRSLHFDLEIIQRLPLNAKAVLEIPSTLFSNLPHKSFLRVDHSERQMVRLDLPPLNSLPFKDIRLSHGAEFRCRLILTGMKGKNALGHSIAVRQIFEGDEVGRVTWFFQRQRAPVEA